MVDGAGGTGVLELEHAGHQGHCPDFQSEPELPMGLQPEQSGWATRARIQVTTPTPRYQPGCLNTGGPAGDLHPDRVGKSFSQFHFQFSSVQWLSPVWLFVTPWTAARQASLYITNSWSLLKFMSIESVMPSSHLILCHPFLLLPSIFPSIRVFSNESAYLIRWPKYWSFSFSISPSNKYSGLISFRMDWLDLLAVQGTLKSLLQHLNSKATILLPSAFFIAQLTHPYMTTRKTIALTRWNLAGKIMSWLFNMLSRLVIAFLPRSKHLLISWLQWFWNPRK